jgi:stage II sporulation protein D
LPLLALLVLGWPPGCAQKDGAAPAGAPTVRVRVLEARDQVTVATSDAMAIRADSGAGPRRLDVAGRQPLPVHRTPSGWRVGGLAVDARELTFLPLGEGGHLSVNGEPYRGTLRVVPVSGDRFDVVNDLDVDSYLKGVVAKEMLHDWHDEAYKAQAIVARTYALYELRTAGSGRHWDLYPDERSQVYGGIKGESAKSRRAVDATVGVVVAAGPAGRQRIFKAYFSACCGGIAQSANDAFGDPPSEPLSGRVVGNRCNMSPRFNWPPVVIRKDELTRRLRSWGASRNGPEKHIGTVDRIEIAYANPPDGRPIRFIITDDRGRSYHIGGTDLRAAINAGAPSDATKVSSSFFNPSNQADDIRFVDGHGFGHGVGLCQWCAEAQARAGTRHEDIVIDAYKGSSLQRAY